ncbi:CAAD domain-containing protein [Cyanobium sp. CH-040]|uniref:CAAD domain-containing protein n=1 Tax=Cyanobium sp. CH-040 TaxID=2823708 RepID=UPI0020CE151D|nr:CAAD domain-containing protein [Cyanobium sp. CH-040]MCP9926533.1 CAAD domain-containing protein [Cyanobium sp. CH-040]
MADTPRDEIHDEIHSDNLPPQSTSASSTPADSTPADSAPGEAADADIAASSGTGAETPAPATPVMATAPEAPAASAGADSAAHAAPVLEASTTVPPLSGAGTGGSAAGSEGGEWELLVEKLQQWWASGKLQSFWQQARTPLTLGLGLVAVLLVLRVYAGLLAAINSLPLVPGLLELVGVIWLLRNGLPRVIRRSEREQLLQGLQQRWQSFSGRG